MRKILITGATGFVATHLVNDLRRRWPKAEVIATARRGPPSSRLDVTDAASVRALIAHLQPTHVVNLAAVSTLAEAAQDVQGAWRIHLGGTLNLARAILDHAPQACFLAIGSGEIYGATGQGGHALTEEDILAPMNEYAASKAAADLAVGALASSGLHAIRLRPFNHSGPGQSDRFVVPRFARQIARMEAGLAPPEIVVGNLGAERDFLDVRDVAAAYALAIERSSGIPPGTILNIASGVPVRIETILEKLLLRARMAITVRQDPALVRPADAPRYVGNAGRAQALLGWAPQFTIDETLEDVLAFERRAIDPGFDPQGGT